MDRAWMSSSYAMLYIFLMSFCVNAHSVIHINGLRNTFALSQRKKNVKLSSLTATTLHSHRIHSINGWNGIVWFVSCLNIIRMRAPVSAFASHVFRIQCSQRFIFTYLIFAIVNLLKQVFFFCTLKHRIYLYLMKKILIIYLMIQLQCILHFNAAHIHDMSNSCFVIVSYARCLLLYGNCIWFLCLFFFYHIQDVFVRHSHIIR